MWCLSMSSALQIKVENSAHPGKWHACNYFSIFFASLCFSDMNHCLPYFSFKNFQKIQYNLFCLFFFFGGVGVGGTLLAYRILVPQTRDPTHASHPLSLTHTPYPATALGVRSLNHLTTTWEIPNPTFWSKKTIFLIDVDTFTRKLSFLAALNLTELFFEVWRKSFPQQTA